MKCRENDKRNCETVGDLHHIFGIVKKKPHIFYHTLNKFSANHINVECMFNMTHNVFENDINYLYFLKTPTRDHPRLVFNNSPAAEDIKAPNKKPWMQTPQLVIK